MRSGDKVDTDSLPATIRVSLAAPRPSGSGRLFRQFVAEPADSGADAGGLVDLILANGFRRERLFGREDPFAGLGFFAEPEIASRPNRA